MNNNELKFVEAKSTDIREFVEAKSTDIREFVEAKSTDIREIAYKHDHYVGIVNFQYVL